MLFIPAHIAAIVVLMRLFARGEADFDLPKCVLVFGVTLVVLTYATLGIGPWALPLYFLLPFVILGTLFYLPWPKAAAVAGCFLAYLFLFGLTYQAISK